jgi:hypothetical protein
VVSAVTILIPNTEKVKLYNAQYYQKNKKRLQEYKKQQYQKNKKKINMQKMIYFNTQNGRSAKRRAGTKYIKTKKGKLATKRYQISLKGKKSKMRMNAKRKRNLDWIEIFENPFDDSEITEWHHIDNKHVIVIPKYLHRLYLGKNHRENTMEIVKQIYRVINNG